jgi:DNA polymerase-3 subunit alpha
MCDNNKSKIKYVNLHAHTTFSVFDGLGYPSEHIDFALSNGLEAHAFTDHGNMNAVPFIVEHLKKLKSEGKEFKPIFGVEGYIIPSMQNWLEIYKNSKNKKKSKGSETNATVIEDEDRESLKSELKERRHMTLVAKNKTGLYNLFEMVSDSFEKPNYYYYPRMDFKMLKEHSEGLIGTTSCLGGILATEYWKYSEEGATYVYEKMREVTEQMLDIFGDDFYGELQWNKIPEQHFLNQCVIKLSKEYGFPLISTADVHYPSPEAWKSREVYKRIGNSWIEKKEGPIPPSLEDMDYQLWPKNGDQMWEEYKKYSQMAGVDYDDSLVLESIERTHEIAFEHIEDVLPDTNVRLPAFVVPENSSADAELSEIVHTRLEKKFLEKSEYPEYLARVERELKVIADRGFSKYFLTMSAINEEAKKEMLVGPGRGSAGGSLVAYLLEITEVDPIKNGLLFERFLRSDATDYPDIDYDVSDNTRIKEVLVEKWGKDTVVPISNWNTLQLRSLIKDISRYYDIPFDEVNKVTNVMIHEATGPAKARHGIKAGVYTPTFEEVKEFSTSLQKFLKDHPEVEQHVDDLYGQIRSCSRHAGGVVIADDLNKQLPLISSGGVTQVPWSEGQNVRHLEPMGFIKFDLLGLKTLRVMEICISHILRREQGIENPTFADIRKFYDENLHGDVINTNDQQVYENIFHQGKWAGIFQFTEKGAQNFCKDAKPRSLVDIATITSIYRPGPLSANVDAKYIEKKNNPDTIEYVNDIFREETEESYGFCIFQEQIAKLAHRLGKNVSLDEGNMLRKVLTKKGTGKTAKVKNKIHDKFIEGCVEKGMSNRQAAELWNLFEYFSGYGFNKSHAIAYSLISFQCAWLLNYYPSCWLAAFLTEENDDEKRGKAISIVRSFGYDVKTPSLNFSSDVWQISKDGLAFYQPLTDIKGVGDSAYEQIIEHRPFVSMSDFLFREEVDRRSVNKTVVSSLIQSGALQEFVENGPFENTKHMFLSCIVERPSSEKELRENISNFSGTEDFTKIEKIAFLETLTQIYPLRYVIDDELLKRLEKKCIPPIGEYDPDLNYCWFIPKNKNVRYTRASKKPYYELEVTDSTYKVTKIKCWGINPEKDFVSLNKPHIAELDYDPKWGFSTRRMWKDFIMIK